MNAKLASVLIAGGSGNLGRLVAVEQLIDSRPAVVDDSDARRDWNWNPTFDPGRSADRMLELLRANADRSGNAGKGERR